MPLDLRKEKTPLGKMVYQWTIKEYEQHSRDRRWYVGMGIIGVALVAYGLLSNNYLFEIGRAHV